uniref:DUF148 domain-containing protein n=1 Tax=Rhabditophanes sp. KR3021 TaxID=114890 RepID=A0AC35TVV9_9BILA
MSKLAVTLAFVATLAFISGDYNKQSPLYLALTRAQINQIKYIEEDDVSSKMDVRRNVENYVKGLGGNLGTLYDDFMRTQTSLVQSVKQNRRDLINSSTMTANAKAAQLKIDEIETNDSLSSNQEEQQIRSLKNTLSNSERNELKNFEDGRMNNNVNGRMNNNLGSGNTYYDIYDFDFDEIYEIA